MNPRTVALGLVFALAGIALGWAMMVGLGHILRTTESPPIDTVETIAAPAPATDDSPVPRIKATIFFAADDGQRLVPVEVEVPLAEDLVAQARAVVEAQLAGTPPERLVSTIPEGTSLRGLYISQRREAFVDLDAAVRDAHPGGSMNELITVYTIVNALTVSLPDIEQVQILVDGREVDTLAGHVDLRRPLSKNERLIRTPAAPPEADEES